MHDRAVHQQRRRTAGHVDVFASQSDARERAPVRLLRRLAGPARGLGALVGVEYHLADPHRPGGDLDALVLAAELQALLEAEVLRRDQLLEVVGEITLVDFSSTYFRASIELCNLCEMSCCMKIFGYENRAPPTPVFNDSHNISHWHVGR